MKRYLLLALAFAVLLPPSVALACNCQATHAKALASVQGLQGEVGPGARATTGRTAAREPTKDQRAPQGFQKRRRLR